MQCFGFAFALYWVLQFCHICSKCVGNSFRICSINFADCEKLASVQSRRMGSVGTLSYPLLTITSFTYHYFFYLPFLYFARYKCGKRGESQSYSLLLLLTITSFANCAKLASVQSGREGKSILPITPRWHYTRKLFSPSPVRKSINIDSHAQGNLYFLMSFCKGDTFSGVYG